jgi:NADH-quinone oxidoreductase subunit F
MSTPIASPLLPAGRLDLAAYRAAGGYAALIASRIDVTQTRRLLGETTLTGLGGAHFPFGRKVQLTLVGSGPRVVVCNAAEDEPGSQKDRSLLERNPHVVLEGALLAASAIEANLVYLYVSESLTGALDSLDAALAEVRAGAAELLDGVEVRVHKAPTAYVAGEASAAIRSIEGHDAKPGVQPPFPTESGVHGRPTLVSNCETLANLPRVVRSESTQPELSRLVTVTGDVGAEGVYEVLASETTFGDLIAIAGGMTGGRPVLKAVQPGGPSSAFLSASAAQVPLANADIVAAGSQPGCLAVRVLSEDRCMVEAVSELTAFFAREQCGQCPACRMKTQSYDGVIQKIHSGTGTWSLLDQLSAIDDFVADMPRRCALISMPTPPVSSAVKLFRDDFAAHIETSTCGHATA